MTSLTKICIHWSAGANKPCATDLKAYHFLFDKDGKEEWHKTFGTSTVDLFNGAAVSSDGGVEVNRSSIVHPSSSPILSITSRDTYSPLRIFVSVAEDTPVLFAISFCEMPFSFSKFHSL